MASGETKDVQQSANYVTVVPVEYSANLVYNKQAPEYIVEQYSEYPSRNHDDYIKTEELPPNQGSLYSVSQRVQSATTNYTNLCPPEAYSNEQGACLAQTSDASKETNSDGMSDKQSKETIITSIATSVSSCTMPAINVNEILQGPVLPICVYLLDRVAIMMEVEDTPSVTTETLCNAILNSEELGLNKQLASQVLTLWMRSPLLELQLKPTHKPYEVRCAWRSLVERFSHVSYNKQQRDEPILSFQRNLFFPQHLEEKIKDQRIIELLYEEAKHNILDGRYPCEVAHFIMLGGIQARIELGPYNPQVHSTHYFREEQAKYLPTHVRKSSTWTWLPISSKNSAEVRLLEQFKRIPNSATNRKLMRKYLEFCWSLPFYGAVFFEAQIEQPVRGLTSLMTHQDIPVLIGINSKGVYIIDDLQCTLLLGLRYEELSWDYARPSKEKDPNCLQCVFLQFIVVENGTRVSKILQIFSRQANLMDTLISAFIHQLKEKTPDEVDRAYLNQMNAEGDTQTMGNMNHTSASLPSLSNKLSRLTLATFDEDGRCIGQMGSWSFSY